MHGAPWALPFEYVENSPVYFLDRINTPLIMQAGAADIGIINHSDEVWVDLQSLKKAVSRGFIIGSIISVIGFLVLGFFWWGLWTNPDARLAARLLPSQLALNQQRPKTENEHDTESD